MIMMIKKLETPSLITLNLLKKEEMTIAGLL